MKLLDFNINNYVRVQLTDVGRQALKAKHDELNDFANGALGEWKPPEEDADGWSRWQMWELMKGVGDRCGNGFKVPIYTQIKIEI